ncbi:MAG: Bax inhibitor-1/YccA family protein [Elusimicrobiaceae bacterium]|nr:Bax inhibitor-1/YccA family protein [Elusimicrobiaceae bacterium]
MAQNPMFNEEAFKRAQAQHQRGFAMQDGPAAQETFEQPMHVVRGIDRANCMTLQGTINKTFFLLLICVVGGMLSWTNPQAWISYTGLLAIGALVVAIVTAFKPAISMFTAPVYAFLEGTLLGALSAMYNAQWDGIVFNAVSITVLVFFFMLFLYKFQIIRVTNGLMKGIFAATAAIAVLYIGSWILSLFGVSTAYLTSSSPLSIGISVVVCIVAALNFLTDFEFINRMTGEYEAPKYMEWYAGFSLLVTLVWLYLEILRLLGKTRSR